MRSSTVFLPLALLLTLAGMTSQLAAAEADPPAGDGDELPPVAYIPYEDVDEVDPAGKGVFLPYEKFIELWQARRQQQQQDPPPPVGAVLSGYALSGTVGEKSVELSISGTATGLKPEWTTVELPVELAFTGFEPVDPELTLERGANSLNLHLPRAGSFAFTATSAATVERDASGKRSVELVLPNAASGTLELVLPDEALEVDLRPRVPATLTEAGGTTRLRALVGRHRKLTVSWQGEVREQLGPAMLLSDASIACTVNARTLQYRCLGTVSILRNAAPELAVDLPAGVQVLAVEATDLDSWDVEEGRLELRFAEPRKGKIEFDLSLERQLEALAAGEDRELMITLPKVHAAARYTGRVVLVTGEGMSLQVLDAKGYSQINPSEAGMQGAAAAYRHLAVPGGIRLRQTRLESELRSQVHQWTRLGREENRQLVVLDLEVRKAGRFALRFTAPESWELLDLVGSVVDEVRRDEEVTGGRAGYTVSLKQKLLGKAQMVLKFRSPAAVPREAVEATDPFAAHLVRIEDAKQAGGSLLLSAPGSWALTSTEREHLAAAKLDTLTKETPLRGYVRDLGENEVLALAFTYLDQAGAGLELQLAPRPRELKLEQQQLFTVSTGQVRGHLTWRGEVRYSALPALRITAPTALDERLVFKAVDLAEQQVVARDEASGRSTWELRFAAPVLGPVRVSAEYGDDLETKLASGERNGLTLPLIEVDGATRLTSVQAVARDGSLEITADAASLDEINVADLPPGLQGGGVVKAFRGNRATALELVVVRHDLVALADAGVPVVGYRGVVGADRVARVLGVADLISRGRPYLIVRLPAGATMLEVSVDGHQPRTNKREDGDLVVTLGDRGGARSQRVAFVYELSVGAGALGGLADLELPLPEIGISDEDTRPLTVERTEAVVHLPADYRLTGAGGDLALRDGGGFWHQLLFGKRASVAGDPPLDAKTGLTVQLRPIGRAHRFVRLGEGGSIRLGLVSDTTLAWLSLLAAVAGLLAVWFARRWTPVLVALLLALLVALLGISGPWLLVAAAFAAGAVLCPLLLGLRGAWWALRGWRQNRARLVPVPAGLTTADAAQEAPAGPQDIDELLDADEPAGTEAEAGSEPAPPQESVSDADDESGSDVVSGTDGRED